MKHCLICKRKFTHPESQICLVCRSPQKPDEVIEGFKFVIDGKPKALKRPRFATVFRNNRQCTHVYDADKKSKEDDRLKILSQFAGINFTKKLSGPLSIKFVFNMGCITKSTPKSIKDGQPKPTGADIDNLIKYYLDMMNNLVFEDDRMITEIYAKKVYSLEPKTEISIISLKE